MRIGRSLIVIVIGFDSESQSEALYRIGFEASVLSHVMEEVDLSEMIRDDKKFPFIFNFYIFFACGAKIRRN